VRFAAPLVEGRLVARYKRFFADVALADGSVVTAHCPNPGAMIGLNAPGLPAFLSTSANPKRRLPATLELVAVGEHLVGINTMWPNGLVAEALAHGAIAPLAGYDRVRREVRYGTNSRVDFVLERGAVATPSPASIPVAPSPATVPAAPARVGSARPSGEGATVYVEVKNVHLVRRPGLAEFPDCVTARGARHLDELAILAAAGVRAVLLFVVQREDVAAVDVARDLDPAYARAYDRARAAGVEVVACGCSVSRDAIEIVRMLPVVPSAGAGPADSRPPPPGS